MEASEDQGIRTRGSVTLEVLDEAGVMCGGEQPSAAGFGVGVGKRQGRYDVYGIRFGLLNFGLATATLPSPHQRLGTGRNVSWQ